jgi:peroxiredoxin
MKLFAATALALVAALATPALADLKPGAKAPNFTAKAYQGGEPFTYRLNDALKKGPVVVYFFPAAYTKGCNLEARLFSESIDKFKAQKATVIGVTAGKTDELARFSKDTELCSGKFPVAADPGAKIAKMYDAQLKVAGVKALADLSSRTSYVIAPNGKVALAYSNMDPSGHVDRTLAAVTALNTRR